jgi:non-specific serine/threonine protein kinase
MDRVAVRGRKQSAPNNLPHHLTSFVGREAELRSLKALVSTARLVTLTGTGGAGKSRLAAEFAKANATRWPDGGWWIELAATDDVSGAVVATLQLPGRGAAQEVISSWLAARTALLVLDNCEHLVADCAAFCQKVLERCPHLSIIATSREPLGVQGEARWPVAPLRDTDMLLLFESRARLVAPNFKVAAPNLAHVTQICERLDRLPLAIEMAAARIDVMSEQELLSNLNDRFRLLTSGTRAAPERQQTMAAAIDWSYRLLTDDEVRLFRRLSVFQGGFTADAAQAVCGDEAELNLMSLLGDLVQKSMVVADRLDDETTRFRLLESHRAYSLERLHEAGELELMNKRHYEYFMAFSARTSARTGPKYEGSAPGVAEQQSKARETANLWAALLWARDHTDDMGLSLALEVTASQFIDHARGTTLLLDLLRESSESAAGPLRAKAMVMTAARLSRQSDPEASQSMADASVTLARKVSDPELLAYILNSAGMVYASGGQLDTAVRLCNEAVSLLKGSGNLRLLSGVKNGLGLLAVQRGDHTAARDLLTESVAQSRSEGNKSRTAQHLESLANAQLGLGDIQGATASWSESLSVFRDLNDPFGTIWCLGGLALVAAATGDQERALRLAAAVDRISREWSLGTSSFRIRQLEDATRRARAALGNRKSDGAWNDGLTMSLARALEYALGEGKLEPEAEVDAGPLSRREIEVVAMVTAGMTNRQIAERLFIAERTAEGHVERIRNKLGVRSRTGVATWAVEHGIAAHSLDKNPPTSSV